MARKPTKVDITGWRFAQQVWGSNGPSRDEFVAWVRRFLTSRQVFIDKVEVEFKRTHKPIGSENRPMLGCAGADKVSVFPWGWGVMTDAKMEGVVGHELFHICCRAKGLKYDWTIPYLSRPEEIAAFRIGYRTEHRRIK